MQRPAPLGSNPSNLHRRLGPAPQLEFAGLKDTSANYHDKMRFMAEIRAAHGLPVTQLRTPGADLQSPTPSPAPSPAPKAPLDRKAE